MEEARRKVGCMNSAKRRTGDVIFAQLELHCPSQGIIEIIPEVLWNQFVTTIKEAIQDSGVAPSDITALGLSTQRATFTTWNKKTGKSYHNFICWNDTRSVKRADSINNSWSFMGLRTGATLLYGLSCGSRRWETASVFKFTSQHVTMRLGWVIDNIPKLKKDIAKDLVHYGAVDTWLVWKLTKGKVHATDLSNFSTTGMYDVFKKGYNNIHMAYLGLPTNILPEIKDTNGDYGIVDPELFGASIPIRAVIADQQAAMFGQCCFNEGDIKLTMGTGSFLVINTGPRPTVPYDGAYPLVGWQIGNEMTYIMECNDADTGTVVEWGVKMGFYDDPSQSAPVAESVANSGGSVSFLHSKDFKVVQLHKLGLDKCRTVVKQIIWFVGMSSRETKKSSNVLSGGAFMAGLTVGIWKDRDEIQNLRTIDTTFHSESLKEDYRVTIKAWEKAVDRSLDWYSESS
ncbi:putative glycerol kinase 5 [Apostichopus japonicus]|uniref:Putative glycerol kinase 5 n=1 Tax=Stichopus japonicus TaxID=307972 RepID=A0A2G8LBS2_STIJA|nr:putative glycerol kinase 5 [Apostichopus japonicus]